MTKNISLSDIVYKKLDIIRGAKSRLLSFGTLLELLADEKLQYANDNAVKNLLAFSMCEKFVFEVYRAGLLRHQDQQYTMAIREIVMGNFEQAIAIIQGLIDPQQEKLK